jgi:hypothetical protein
MNFQSKQKTILLQVHDKWAEIGQIDVTTGVARISLKDQKTQPGPFHGFLVIERGHAKSVYSDNGTLFLQIDNRRWDLTQDNVKIHFKRLNWKKNRVRVEALGEIVFHEDYPSALTDPVNANDPTFDGMDEEAFDFWLWLSRCAGEPKWQTDVLNLWTRGFRY